MSKWSGKKNVFSPRDLLEAIGLGFAGFLDAACGSRSTTPRANGPSDIAPRFAAIQHADEPNGDLCPRRVAEFVVRAGPEVGSRFEFQISDGELNRAHRRHLPRSDAGRDRHEGRRQDASPNENGARRKVCLPHRTIDTHTLPTSIEGHRSPVSICLMARRPWEHTRLPPFVRPLFAHPSGSSLPA
jgi:hypothetical protein